MAFFEWTPNLSVGLDTVDRQHRMLIGFINELDDAVTQGKHVDMFKVYRYEQGEDHAFGHRAFIAAIEQFESRQASGDPGVASELLEFLKAWLSDHILIEDKAYAAVLIERGAC